MSGKETRALTEEWPLLFSLFGMKVHFKLLTGVHINEGFEEAMASKLARVLEYFQSLPLERTNIAAKRRADIQAGGGPCGAVFMLLKHFKEDCARQNTCHPHHALLYVVSERQHNVCALYVNRDM